MTNRYAAFLRAINVGKRRIKMDALRDSFHALGFVDVKTYIASGNITFAADAEIDGLPDRIAAHLEAKFGFDVPTFVRSAADLAALAFDPDFARAEGVAEPVRYVVFVDQPLTAEHSATLKALDSDVDRFVASGSEIHWLRDRAAGESMLTSELEKELRVVATRRNMNTIHKMLADLSRHVG